MAMTLDQKVDRILQLLDGDGDDAPGVLHRLGRLERALEGNDKTMGLRTKVSIMWRAHIWILCTASGIAGVIAQHFFHFVT